MSDRARRTKAEANRQNAAKSTGPKDTTSTRYNAIKHGLLSEGVTELDAVDYAKLVGVLKEQMQPEGQIEHFLVERVALCMVRLKRACLLEAEYITARLNPPVTETRGGLLLPKDGLLGETIVLDPGIPAHLSVEGVEHLVEKFQRYETAIENRLFRTLNQLERMQRLRQGDQLPAPVNVEVGVHSAKE